MTKYTLPVSHNVTQVNSQLPPSAPTWHAQLLSFYIDAA